MVAEYKACSFKKNARKGIVSKSEKAYRSVYQSLYYVSANCSDRRIYIDTFIGIDISKFQFIALMQTEIYLLLIIKPYTKSTHSEKLTNMSIKRRMKLLIKF